MDSILSFICKSSMNPAFYDRKSPQTFPSSELLSACLHQYVFPCLGVLLFFNFGSLCFILWWQAAGYKFGSLGHIDLIENDKMDEIKGVSVDKRTKGWALGHSKDWKEEEPVEETDNDQGGERKAKRCPRSQWRTILEQKMINSQMLLIDNLMQLAIISTLT